MPNSAASALKGDQSKPKPEKKGSLEAFKAVFAYAKPHKLAFVGVFVCALLGISADLLQPYLVKIVIDDHLAIGKKDFGLIAIIAAVYLGISIISFIFTYLQNNLLQYAGQSIVAKIRNDLFGHISKLSMSYFDKVHRGSLVTNVSSDTETISQFFTQVLLSLIRDGMTLILIIVFMFQLDVTLAWYCLIALPVIGLVAFLFRRYLREAYQTTRSRLSRLIGFIAENLSGMGLIQAFRQEEEQTRRFTEHNQSYWEGNMREVRANVLFNRTFDFLGNAALVLVVWLGGMAVFHKQIEVGVLYAFTSYIRQFFAPINQITMQWNTFQSTMVSMDRIWSIFSTRPAVKEPAPDKAIRLPVEQVKGRIDFNHISFGYTSAQPVIPDLDLHIRAGEMIGVVGTTGAGKSTLISLLNRFYDVNAGSIEIDGVDIRRLPQSQVHRIVGLIQQEPYLFSGSILDNVRLFQEDISREKVVEACQFVGAHDMIMRMPGGYETPLTERGSGLSAGERQLISFARIVVFKPKILILDEATANLDSQTEQLVQDALQSVSKGRTTIVIAHRLSTVMHADRIIVMKNGRAVEQGTHDQLLTQRGYYEELYRHAKQASGQ
ncbi:ABC transporter ATP-binding protein [Paenibacillus physcomitrellae]|uniref:Lipid A ABC transporter permease/ATP-binding protein n=1 Tax=Paenibacillus physcomitrellae TaxID=1619311 RepID=A0ABQ1G2L4_9BACL|nr:ABC transporter ATP-binding protein [Paenibacillus physcomitrellae]GGA36278.1 lipid A ABC transporter permease/ATP-binding protein [Paenibacillus physcomitrellae]